jgi:glucose-1-phosphate cytidylyltransferase
MQAVILAGGYGTRISEESQIRPKPMAEVGGRPILWHILKIYAAHGIADFVICCGYKAAMIKDYFANYFLHSADVTFDLRTNSMEIHRAVAEPWRVTLVDTGEATMTGGRIRRVRDYLGEQSFCLTYGDGVGNIDLSALIAFHKAQGGYATLTAVQPPGRFGAFSLAENSSRIASFHEKPAGDGAGAYVNGGFFVCEPQVFDYIADDSTVWERESLEQLARAGQLSAFRHDGFWQPMDTLRDKNYLEELWRSNRAPWKVW